MQLKATDAGSASDAVDVSASPGAARKNWSSQLRKLVQLKEALVTDAMRF